VTLTRFIEQARQAARLVQAGGEAPRLEVTDALATALAMPVAIVAQMRATPTRQQLEIVGPYLNRVLAAEKHAKLDAAARAASALAEQVRATAQTTADGATLRRDVFASLVAVPAFNALRLDSVNDVPWACPRTLLSRVMASVRDCRGTTVTLLPGRLVIAYATETRPCGRFVLFDQSRAVGRSAVLAINLCRRATSIASPMPSRRRDIYASDRHWLADAVYALVDQLLAA